MSIHNAIIYSTEKDQIYHCTIRNSLNSLLEEYI